MNKDIFMAYDVRGVYPDDIDENDAYIIGKAYAEYLKPKKVALGRDVRISGKKMWEGCARGLTEMGVDVVDIGEISTDMLYFTVANYNLDGGISITASHNPKQYNGMKLVREGSIPISSDTGLYDIRDFALKNEFKPAEKRGKIEKLDMLDAYVDKVLTIIDTKRIKPHKVVVNPNFGASGKAIQKIADELNLELVKINFEPDGTFPKGRPDPLVAETRQETSQLVVESGADFGVSWDADADRIYWFDENGTFVDGYYEGVVLSVGMLKKFPGVKIIHDPRLVWAAEEVIRENGGIPIENKCGHTFIKERMRKEDAAFAFENSGHMFFKDFYYCDNGLIPFVLILEIMSCTGKKLSEVVDPVRYKYPVSGEINFQVKNTDKVIAALEEFYKEGKRDYTEGVSIDFGDWRFNIRKSNTEPVVRLNVEARDVNTIDPKMAEIVSVIRDYLVSA